jgi:Zn-dependent protease
LFDSINLATILVSYVALLFSLSVHEASHAGAAFLLGDHTAQEKGRLTLNPFAHMDILGTVVFPLMGLLFGGFFIGWAKPVPFNPLRFTRKIRMKTGDAIVSFAGPASNLGLTMVFLVALCLMVAFMSGDVDGRFQMLRAAFMGPQALSRYLIDPGTLTFLSLAGALVQINLLLAVFNLIPLGPLDGAGVLRAFIPDKYIYRYDQLRHHPATWIILMILMFTGTIGFILGPVRSLFSIFILSPVARLILGV